MEGYQILIVVLFSALFLIIGIIIGRSNTKNVSLSSSHNLLIEAMAEQVNISKKEATAFILEVGFSTMIASRKVVDGKAGMEVAMEELSKVISKDENVGRMAELLAIWHEKGK